MTAPHDPLPNFRDFCEQACISLWGEPDKRDRKQLRWNGADAYSGKTFSLTKRAWFDHAEQRGGSTLDLVAHSKGQPKHELKGSSVLRRVARSARHGPPAGPAAREEAQRRRRPDHRNLSVPR
jgi:hypothetical protein